MATIISVLNTQRFLQERQKQLESLGISLQSSGIRVVDDKCFLVNLNADPALNELLVYYLKVGRAYRRGPLLLFFLFFLMRGNVVQRCNHLLPLSRNTPAWARPSRRTSSCAGWPSKLSTASSTSARGTAWCSVLTAMLGACSKLSR